MRRWIHDVFGQDLLVLDGDDPHLKAAFADHMVQDIEEGTLHMEVSRVNDVLESAGHAPQVHVRETNLFHLGEDGRHRLIQHGKGWSAGNTTWESTAALVGAVRARPADFSPNALFRPLYQAFLLPDVAVVGGLAEVAYWLQLSTAHAAFRLPAPALVPRDGARIAPRPWMELAGRLGIGADNLGEPLEAWEARWLSGQDVPDVGAWREAMDREADRARMAFSGVDATLSGSVEAARAKIHKLLASSRGRGDAPSGAVTRMSWPSWRGSTGGSIPKGWRRSGWPMCMPCRPRGRVRSPSWRCSTVHFSRGIGEKFGVLSCTNCSTRSPNFAHGRQ